MVKQTNLDGVKKTALLFLNIDPKPTQIPFIIDHPFFDSIVLSDGKNIFNLFENPVAFKNYKEEVARRITSGNLDTIFALILTKYYLAFLKYSKPYLSKKDFDTYFAYSWISAENPNQDANVSIRTLISWFRAANKKYLMSESELKYYNSLSDTVTVYRGVARGRANKEGLSWTGNIKTAQWFANRFNSKGEILVGKIHKEDIFAYFNGRNEDELVCNSSKIELVRF